MKKLTIWNDFCFISLVVSKILGIDLGTTNSCMAIMEGNEPVVIPNAEGTRTTPSVVAFTKNGERLVGQAAKRQAVTNPHNTIFSAKRLIGRKFNEVKDQSLVLPYKIVEGRNGDAWIEIEVKGKKEQMAPERIASMILSKLKADAESYIGEKLEKAVITVPAYFNDAQRQATKDAGKIAGFQVERIINEPTAASLAYGLDKKNEETIAVYDLGGGTFDISILEIGDGVFEVKATNGDTQLGGDNWDLLTINWMIDDFKKNHGIDLRKDPMALQRLKEEAEKSKITLSSAQQTDINLPFITADASGPKHLNLLLTRSKLEQICEDLYKRTVAPFEACLKDAGMNAGNVNNLILVGGMTRSPKIIEVAGGLAGKSANQGVNPDEVVAIGASIQGGVLRGDVRDVLLLDVTPLTLGIETAGGVSTAIIERNTTIPTKKSQIFSTYSDNQTAVDVKVLQGERSMAKDNKMLGNFRLEGIPSAARGIPQIEVTFDIDVNGILHVAAKDKGSGKDQKIIIKGASGLNEDEVERLRKDAKQHAAEDKKKRDTVEALNQLDNLIYQTEKQLKESSKTISKDKKSEIESCIIEARGILNKTDVDVSEIKSITEKMTLVVQDINKNPESSNNSDSSTKEKPVGENSSSNDSSGNEDKKSNVVEADFEVVDGDK